ncbi:MAG TPA: prepilin-type N-terminal cleavage/methylation domain-containing protein [Burkholderiaceae bacterium]|nr:prepilin-type N-terminal cleavage/methylation domain-containing protein [Burkholderiaceae bacterium]
MLKSDSLYLRPVARQRQQGLSMVELMVGVAIGLFVVAGATMAVSNQLGDNRRLMLETQTQQDLRAAVDVIARELRRSGYWARAQDGVWYAGAVAVTANPYTAMTPASGVANDVRFGYSRGAVENNALDATDEAGFRVVDNAIQMRTGGQWQTLTDNTTLRITSFRVTLIGQDVPLACFTPCPVGATACPPTQTVREAKVEISGTATHDPSVQRNARSQVRLRNDVVNGACPA